MSEKELQELKEKIESLILQSEKQKSIKFQMQRIAYRNVLTLIAEVESLHSEV